MKKLLLGLVLCTNVALAKSTGGGNGGDGILCYDQAGNIELAQVLDYYEMDNKTLYKNALKHIEGDYKTKVEFVINKIKMLNEAQGELVEEYYKKFLRTHKLTNYAVLDEVDDSDLTKIALPRNCEMVQAAVQYLRHDKTSPKYLIDNQVWGYFDEIEKAGLVLHEIFYSLHIDSFSHYDYQGNWVHLDLDKINSNSTRKLVMYISSAEFLLEAVDLEKFNSFVDHDNAIVDLRINQFYGKEINVDSFLLTALNTSAESLGYKQDNLVGLFVKYEEGGRFLANQYKRINYTVESFHKDINSKYIIFNRRTGEYVLDEHGRFYDADGSIVASTRGIDFGKKVTIQNIDFQNTNIVIDTKEELRFIYYLSESFWDANEMSLADRFTSHIDRSGELEIELEMANGRLIGLKDIVTSKSSSVYISYNKKRGIVNFISINGKVYR